MDVIFSCILCCSMTEIKKLIFLYCYTIKELLFKNYYKNISQSLKLAYTILHFSKAKHQGADLF